jgi:hypothetical protein
MEIPIEETSDKQDLVTAIRVLNAKIFLSARPSAISVAKKTTMCASSDNTATGAGARSKFQTEHRVLFTKQEMITARNATNVQGQDFMANDELLLPILKAFAQCTRSQYATRKL